jgi:hypothetical protein
MGTAVMSQSTTTATIRKYDLEKPTVCLTPSRIGPWMALQHQAFVALGICFRRKIGVVEVSLALPLKPMLWRFSKRQHKKDVEKSMLFQERQQRSQCFATHDQAHLSPVAAVSERQRRTLSFILIKFMQTTMHHFV